jgi:hypothetical protein
MSPRRITFVGGLLLLLGAVALWWLRSSRPLPLDASAAPTVAIATATAEVTAGGAGSTTIARTAVPASAQRAAPTSVPTAPRRFAPGGRAALIRRLAETHGRAAGDGGSRIAGVIDKDYLKAQIRGLQPLLRECYEQALERQPGLTGKLVVDFAIEGEPDAGALVTESAIDPTSSLHEAGLAECVRETMYALELPAPTTGGRVRVKYPFVFRSAAADAGR